jgi:phosphoribosylglycinamide formyltransferase-1
MRKRKKNIVLFASGNGTNAENIIRYFQQSDVIHITEILTNNPKAGVIERAKKLNVPVRVFTRADFDSPQILIHHLGEQQTDLIVLAGFLWKIPTALIRQFSGKMINLHPALLPEFGGKGMYGLRVHEAVIAAEKKKSGITIHFVNENYDEGKIIFQAKTEVTREDTPESLAEKIHQLEYKYFPQVIEDIMSGR